MNLSSEDLFAILIRRVSEDTPHADYDRTVDHATWCKQMVTGDDQSEILISYKIRETQKQVDQRLRITNSRTQYVTNKVKKLYNEVHRCDDVIESISYTTKNELALQELTNALNTWYENKPLKKYLASRVKDLIFEDPNAYLIVEFINDDPVNKKPTVYPLEVRSDEIYDQKYVNGVLKYLTVRHEIVYKSNKSNEGTSGYQFTMYGIGYSWVMQHIPDDAVFEMPVGWGEIYLQVGDETGERRYIFQGFESKTTECPAFRVGYMDDPHTNGRTKVSPMYPAIHILTDLIWNKSEYDLSKALHGFYQKFVYVDKCKPCDGTGEVTVYNENHSQHYNTSCTNCKGSGKDIHTTVQDIIAILKPDDPTQMVDLSRMIYFAEIPASLITMQREDFVSDQKDVFNAIFGSNVLERSEIVETATAKNYDWRAVNNTLFEYADHISECFKFSVRVTANHRGESDGLVVQHAHPYDFKLESIQDLVDLRISAANLPRSIQTTMEMAILSKQHKDDPEYLKNYNAREKFKPFKEKGDNERTMLLSMLPNDDPERLLYIYYERIMDDIFDENKSFADFPYKKQKDIVYKKVSDIIIAKGVKQSLSTVLSDAMAPTDQEFEETEVIDENDPQVKLRGSVGGVSGIVQIASAVADGTMTATAAETILNELYGLDPATSKKIVTIPPTKKRATEAAAVKGIKPM